VFLHEYFQKLRRIPRPSFSDSSPKHKKLFNQRHSIIFQLPPSRSARYSLYTGFIHKSLRDFRPLRYSSRDGHAEGEHVNRGRDNPSFSPTLQVLDMCTLGDAADVNPVIKFLRHALQRVPRHQCCTYGAPVR
jgi:hypothetical protein